MVTATSVTNAAAIPGLEELWAETLGDSRICVAVLDGPVDQSHPSLAAATLTRLETLVPGVADEGPASRHGTHVASVIFGQHDGPVKGIAPQCRSLIIPIFSDGAEGTLAPCSQLDLARAISQAVQQGAHVINISGGELTPSGTAHPLLANAVRNCADQGVLIVAAAGNEGCACLHAPGALPSVLAVGAMNAQGEPLAFSNWGAQYQTQGILAHGQDILGASPGGGTVTNSGTGAGVYDLDDQLAPGEGVSVVGIQGVSSDAPNPVAINPGFDGLDDQRIVTGQPIAGAAEGAQVVHTYSVIVRYAVDLAGIEVPAGDSCLGENGEPLPGTL
ncbi:MAG: S8 family serine peptidase, partial [Rhodothermales bacterium]